MSWQPKLGATGERVEGLDELEQSLRIVLKTPVGSVPGRPRFGSLLHRFLDLPAASAMPKIVAEIPRALRECEPRIKVLGVTADTVDEEGRLRPTVRWQRANPQDARDAASRETTL